MKHKIIHSAGLRDIHSELEDGWYFIPGMPLVLKPDGSLYACLQDVPPDQVPQVPDAPEKPLYGAWSRYNERWKDGVSGHDPRLIAMICHNLNKDGAPGSPYLVREVASDGQQVLGKEEWERC